MSYKIAVVGATGNVGRAMLGCLAERNFPVHTIVALASQDSVGKKISFGDKTIEVEALHGYDFEGTDIALFSAGSAVSEKFVPKATAAGCIVIDNASFFRMDSEVPLIVPEVNAEFISSYENKNIIANPNCCAIPLALALKPLHERMPIKRVVVSTYQSVSGAGKNAMDELYNQTKGKYMNTNVPNEQFPKQIAFNVIPHIDSYLPGGETKEEWKLRNEVLKIMQADFAISTTCVRVPVFVGHCESVNVEFFDTISYQEACDILSEAPGVALIESEDEIRYLTPIEATGDDLTYVCRLRQDPTLDTVLNFWLVSDNLRKGAALNAVQIAEELVQKYL